MKYLIATLFSTFFIYSFAQNTKPQSPQPYIEVIGTAKKEVIPDKIFLSVTLSEKTVNNKSFSIQQQDEILFNIIEKLKIDRTKIKLSDLASEIQIVKKKETGVQITKDYIVELKNSTEASNLLKELSEKNIKEFSILRIESSEIDRHRKEVRIEAIKAAKDKAEYLLNAIGETPGKPIEIREIPNTVYRQNLLFNQQSPTEENEENNFKTIPVEFSFYIKYAIR